MKTKSQHRFRKEMIHLNESHQLKHGNWCKCQGPCPKGINSSVIFLIKKMIKTWTSDRLAEVQGATKVTVQGKKE